MNDTFLVDANVLLALLQPAHSRRAEAEGAARELERRFDRLVLAHQTLYEIYVTVTRPTDSPGGWGLSPADAKLLLDKLQVTYTLLDERPLFDTWQRLVATYNTRGKPSHDARLVSFAIEHGLSQILTFNTRDFTRYAPEGVTPIHPASLAPPAREGYEGNALEDLATAFTGISESSRKRNDITAHLKENLKTCNAQLQRIFNCSSSDFEKRHMVREKLILLSASMGDAATRLRQEMNVAKECVALADKVAPHLADSFNLGDSDHCALARQLAALLKEGMTGGYAALEVIQGNREALSELDSVPEIPDFATNRDRLLTVLDEVAAVYNQDWFAMQDMVDGLTASLGEDAAPHAP